LTGSRGGWLATFVGTAVALALQVGRPRLARALAAAAAAILALVLSLSAGAYADDLAARGGDRPWYWHVAWKEIADAPLAGAGAGTFELAWLERQPVPVTVRDAHSLYLELLAELGIVGFVLLGLALTPPLRAGFRGGSAAAAGGYVAFLAHAGLDWDWELPAVTVAGLLCGAALLAEENASSRARSRLLGSNRQEGAS
jgi:O-antigen ligase